MTTKRKTRPTIARRIRKLDPCREATTWAKRYKSPAAAWKACQRGDWMLWLLGKLSGLPESEGRKKLVLCCCECARLAVPIWQKQFPYDDRVVKCLETTERWARGETTIDELRKAEVAAYAASAASAASAAAAAKAAAAAAAAKAAAAAAAAAANAAYAAAAAAKGAYAAAAAAKAAAAAAANAAVWLSTLRQCAEIVRKHYPKPPTL